MKICSQGAAGMVTGSCHLVETDGLKFLIDCGMFQGNAQESKMNWEEFSFDPTQIDFVILTHSHIDHCGRLPLLVKRGFSGRVFVTRPAADVAEVMLLDSARIQEADSERRNRKLLRAGDDPVEPLYSEDDALDAISMLNPIEFEQKQSIGDVSFSLHPAGHLLGAAYVKIDIEGRSVVFSGDIGHKHTLLYDRPDPVGECDIMVVETTYGNRMHTNMDKREQMLYDEVLETLDRGGNVIIPAFSVGRTQEVIYTLNKMQRKDGRLSKYRIFSDSPLSIEATELYLKHIDYLKEPLEPKDFHMGNLKYIKNAQESALLNTDKDPKVIISSSGMCEGGRILHHLKHYLWRDSTKVIFVGYQGEDTLGRKILTGAPKVTIMGDTVAVKAQIQYVDGFSGHADKEGIMEFIDSAQGLEEVVLIHGEKESLDEMKKSLSGRFNTTISRIYEDIIF